MSPLSSPANRRRSAAVAALALAVLASAAMAQVQQGPPPVQLDPAPNAAFMPVFYKDGRMAMDRHRFLEDPGNSVFALTYDFVALDAAHAQTTANPDILVLNYANFEPPEGVAAPTRRLCLDSIQRKGLQLYVNYANAIVDPSDPQQRRYKDGTFFLSLDPWVTGSSGFQTVIPTPDLGFSGETISATRAALGEINLLAPAPGEPAPIPTGGQMPTVRPAIYITASIGYALTDLDPLDQGIAPLAARDRLMVYDPSQGKWINENWRVPASAKEGNSSGVAFADFNGDGHMDLYVGLQGDNYVGAPNVLCIYDPATGYFVDQTATRVVNGEYAGATNDVAAADIDQDGDLDIVVGNRMIRGGPAGPESHDYYLLNDGSGNFTRQMLPLVASDTRSVAVANLDEPTTGTPLTAMEIIFGNAGSEGYESSWQIPAANDHSMQIFRSMTALPALAYQDRTNGGAIGMSPDTEKFATTPLTHQIVAKDVFRGAGSSGPTWEPDGWVDIVCVNMREHLKNEVQAPVSGTVSRPPNNVAFLVNHGAATIPAGNWRFSLAVAVPTYWGRTIAFGDFLSSASHPGGDLDIFVGSGNRWSGHLPTLYWNTGATTVPGRPPFGFLDLSYDILPGTEHGYGFDFADYNGDGYLDAIQTSRGYDFLTNGVHAPPQGHVNWHLDFTEPMSLQQTTNFRGRKNPAGMEDGVFADFDQDGDLDLILCSQRFASSSTPGNYSMQASQSADTIVLEQTPTGFRHETVITPTTNGTSAGAPILVDRKIDLNNRDGDQQPGIADRVVAADLDGDDDIDAIVHLFSIGSAPTKPVTAANGFPLPKGRYSYGFRYLENVRSTSTTGHWFKDVAPRSMKNAAGAYDAKWNRGLGYDVLGDFDNNGYLDLYTTHGRATYAANGPSGSTSPEVMDIAQLDDLLFMNAVGGASPGTLVEQSALYLPPRAVDEVNGDFDPTHDSAGSMCVAQGDIDNDGDADVVVTHHEGNSRTTLPWLLVNRLNETAAKFVDEFEARMVWSTLNPTIHTDPASFTDYSQNPPLSMMVYPSLQHPGVHLDSSESCTLLDWDGDGDLDLVFSVAADLPRFWRNRGADTNGDGRIDAADASPLGTFEDVTDTILLAQKHLPNAADMQAIDVDGDGDLDFATDSFDDLICIWRNEQTLGVRPRLGEIWPRVGRKQGGTITLHGANLDQVDQIEYRFAGQAPIVLGATSLSATRAQATLPTGPNARGLAQVRVRRMVNGTPYWSRQYQSYFVIQ